jgi:hypothetical protein
MNYKREDESMEVTNMEKKRRSYKDFGLTLITIQIETHARLKRYCDLNGLKPHHLVTRAVNDMIDRLEKQSDNQS